MTKNWRQETIKNYMWAGNGKYSHGRGLPSCSAALRSQLIQLRCQRPHLCQLLLHRKAVPRRSFRLVLDGPAVRAGQRCVLVNEALMLFFHGRTAPPGKRHLLIQRFLPLLLLRACTLRLQSCMKRCSLCRPGAQAEMRMETRFGRIERNAPSCTTEDDANAKKQHRW